MCDDNHLMLLKNVKNRHGSENNRLMVPFNRLNLCTLVKYYFDHNLRFATLFEARFEVLES